MALHVTHRRSPGSWTWVLTAAFILWLWRPFFAAHAVDNRESDWTFHANYASYISSTIFERHEFPFWVTSDTYEHFRLRGAHLFFANPEVAVLSLLTPLLFLFSFATTVKLLLALCVVGGTWSCYRLLRACTDDPSPIAASFLAILVLANGALLSHLLTGYISVMVVAFFPLALALFIESLRSGGDGVEGRERWLKTGTAGLVLSALFYAGGVHPLIQFMTVVGVYAGVRALLDHDLIPLGAFIMLAVWLACLSAFKLLVTVRYLYAYKPEYLIGFSGVREFVNSLVSPIADPSPEHEFNTYIGYIGAALVVLGLGRLRRAWMPLLAAAIAAALFSTERFARLLQHVPTLSTQGSFSRFRLVFVLFIGLVAALGLDAILKSALVRSRPVAIAIRALSCVVLLVLGLSLPGTPMARHVDNQASTPFPVLSRVHLEAPELVPADPAASVRIAVETVGVNAFTYHYSSRSSDAPIYLVSPHIRRRSFDVPARVSGDGTVEDLEGRFAVKLAGPEGRVTLSYDRRWGTAGLLVSLGAIGLWIGLLLRPRT